MAAFTARQQRIYNAMYDTLQTYRFTPPRDPSLPEQMHNLIIKFDKLVEQEVKAKK